MGPTLKFLRFSSGPNAERDLGIIGKAIEKSTSSEIDVEIIKDAGEIKKLLESKPLSSQAIYVCFPFEGKVFEKLKESGFRIIGPQCVVSCLMLEKAVPKLLYPVCNIAMEGVMACCSSMKKSDRKELYTLVEYMGGEVTADFTSAVTHLIANEVGSKKYMVAANQHIPIVSPSWIKHCWKISNFEHIVANSEEILKKHILPVFKGCTICVSGLDASQREVIKALSSEHGAVYSGELNMKTCTHLLVKSATGTKYTYAKQWKLHCVLPDWFFDCIKQGHWLPEEPYKVEPEPDSTMMTRSGNLTTRNEIEDTLPNRSSLTNKSTMLYASRAKGSSSSSTSVKAAEVAAKSRKMRSTKNSNEENNCENEYFKIVFKFIKTDSLNVHDLTIQDCGNYYLDGCEIFVAGEQGPVADVCRKIINNGGGMRSFELKESVTHVVVWENVSELVKKFLLDTDGSFPHVVSPTWLLDSFKSGEIMDEKGYSVMTVIEKGGDVTQGPDEVFAKPSNLPSKSSTSSISRTSISMTTNSRFEEDVTDDLKLADQYMSRNHHESTAINQPGHLANQFRLSVSNLTVTDNDQTATLIDNDRTASMEDETMTPFLRDMKFCVKYFNEEEAVNSMIEMSGGSITNSVEGCDHIIVPLVYHKKREVHTKELTICWLETCYDYEELQNAKECFLYRPHFVPKNLTQLLEGCVVTVSQYSIMKKAHLFHFAEALGAVTQDFFVRKDSVRSGVELKASTHLILSKPEGSKYDASVKWKMPCVSKEWLVESLKAGRMLPEADFSLKECNAGANLSRIENLPQQVTTDHKTVQNPKQPTNNEQNLVSFDLSNRGASIMEGFDSVTRPSISVDETQHAPPKTASKSETTKTSDEINNTETAAQNATLKDIYSGKRQETDFASFNTMIAQHSKSGVGEAPTCPAKLIPQNKENNNGFEIPADFKSPKFALNKSRFSFDFGEALDGMQSPAVNSQDLRRKSSRKSRGSLPFDVQFTEALQRAVDREVPEEQRKAIDESFTKKLHSEGILHDVVCVASRKLFSQQAQLYNMVRELGGDTKALYDSTCTHFIHQGRANDSSKDYVQAKDDGKYLVSPHWLKACYENGERVNENEYPITYNPRMSLDVSRTVEKVLKSPVAAQKTSPRSDTPKTGKPETLQLVKSPNNNKSLIVNTDDQTHSKANDTPKEKDNLAQNILQQNMQKKLEELMEASKQPRVRRSRRKTATDNRSIDATPKSEAASLSFNKRLRSRNSSQKSCSESSNSNIGHNTNQAHLDIASEQSQAHTITYDDPTERAARERILAQLKDASPSQDIESFDHPINFHKFKQTPSTTTEAKQKTDEAVNSKKDSAEYKTKVGTKTATSSNKADTSSNKPTNLLQSEDEDKETKQKQTDGKYRFLFSGLTVQEKIEYGAVVEQLGGEFLDVQYFSTQCSHVIVNAPTRSEKYLAAVSSGKWILHKSYLEASREAGRFVDEEDHEWGADLELQQFESSGKRLRMELIEKRLEDPKFNIFKGWNVLMCIETSKVPGVKRIVEAGGGCILATRPPFENKEGATHLFLTDPRLAEKYELNCQQFQDDGLWVLRLEYISDFLTIHPKPSALNYVIAELKKDDESTTKRTSVAAVAGKRKATRVATPQKDKRLRRETSNR